jgi:high affinity Mn2+ porin
MKCAFARTSLAAAAACILVSGPVRGADTGDTRPQEAVPAGAVPVNAPEAGAMAPNGWSLHAQFTAVSQLHPAFRSPYEGANSLSPGFAQKETTDLTAFGAVRLWAGAVAYIDPEIDQGYGLDNTLGVAGFPSGAAYKVGARNPYFRLPRAYVRQVIGLDRSADAPVDTQADPLAGTVSADNLAITVGKFSVVDIFDTNRYAHDPRADFLNWSIIDAGAFDYAADSWGFTYGGALEWTQSWWTLRGGAFALSKVPNGTAIEGSFRQFSLIGEFEERHHVAGQPGTVKLLGFVNRGRMGSYEDAIALGQQTLSVPDTALVRRMASRPGGALNLDQQLGADLGAFARLSANDGTQEAFDFTEINRSISTGLSLRGERWRQPEDTLGLALAINGLSNPARQYFAAGGLGILIGDGKLPDYGYEKIVETYYARTVIDHLTVTADFQWVTNPAYNRDRGPVAIFALRVHADI